MAKLIDNTKPRSIFIVLILILTSFSGLMLIPPHPVRATFSGPQSTPPPTGDWVINTPNNVVVNETITLNGDLVIQNGGSLTFRNVTLLMNCPANGSYYILVESGGEFYIYDYDNDTGTGFDRSVITSSIADNHHRFCFQVNKSAKFEMKNSELHECGTQFPSTLLPISSWGLSIHTNSTIFENNLIYDNFMSLRFDGSSNNIIKNCIIKNNTYYIWIRSNSNNNLISNCSISNNYYSGIAISQSVNNTISNCNIFNGQDGILLSDASNNNIYNTNLSSNYVNGLNVWGASGQNNITYCNITNNYRGIALGTNSQNYISNNSIIGNLFHAIYTTSATNLKAQYNYFGTQTANQLKDLFYGNIDYSNYLTYRPSNILYINSTTQWKDVTKVINDGIIVNGGLTLDNVNLFFNNSHGQNFIQVNNNLSIKNSNLQSNYTYYTILYLNTTTGLIFNSKLDKQRGITLPSQINITNSELKNGYYGIFLNDHNNIDKCNFSYNKKGNICCLGSYNNITNCNIIKGKGSSINGLELSEAYNRIDNCSITHMYRGIQITLNGNGSISNCEISNNTYGIAYYGSSDTNLKNNQLLYNDRGIYLSGCWGAIINNCNFNNNNYGIELTSSSYNNITNCNFSFNNQAGIWIHLVSNNNRIYHNNFISNSIQALDTYTNFWNASYPSGGNYWNDYTGVDNNRGPTQNLAGADGIGDTPYTNINPPGNAQDHYPLMAPYKPNNPPKVLDLNTSHNSVHRTNSIQIYANAQDEATAEDMLIPYFEYNATNTSWRNYSLSNLQYKNNRWEIMFTPGASAELGSYNFRVRFMDYTLQNSSWFYFNDAVDVLNNFPYVQDLTLDHSTSVVNSEVLVWVNGADIEDAEDELVATLEYRDPTETAWNTSYVSSPTFTVNLWEFKFWLPLDAMYGHYDLRVRVNDTDGNSSQWFYSNDSLLVYNSHPQIISVNLSEISVYRTNPVFIQIDTVDHETPASDLDLYLQYHIDGAWQNLTAEFLNDTWEAWFITQKDTILGDYDIRVRVVDNESAEHGWVYLNDSIEVLNNPPVISADLDDLSVSIDLFYTYLTDYESDIEDDYPDLIWTVDDTIDYEFLESVEIIYQSDDVLKITSKLNVTGVEDITLILTDKDGGVDTKIDVTVNVNSLITAETPKVTLLTPVDKTLINTLTPEFKWSLDNPGADIVFYNFYIEDNPTLVTPYPILLTTTSYTPDIPLEDGTTYYWKIVPNNGICVSDDYSFTIDLDFEPVYKVNLSTIYSNLMLKQGDYIDIELTVKNEGNLKDVYRLEITSTDLEPHLTLDRVNIQLVPAGTATVKLGISIPKDIEEGSYFIIVTATSLTESTVTDQQLIGILVMIGDYFPIYEVEITATPDVIETSPGKTETLMLNISNIGNVEDTYTITFQSPDFSGQDINFSTTTVFLSSFEEIQITVTLTVPGDMAPGEYIIRFYAESDEDSDNVRVTVKVLDESEPDGDGEDGDDMAMVIGIGIVIVIIVIIAILLFLFVIRKKPVEEKPEVQESIPQEPTQATAPQFPPPQPQMMPVPQPPPMPQPLAMPEQPPQYYLQPSEQELVGDEASVEE